MPDQRQDKLEENSQVNKAGAVPHLSQAAPATPLPVLFSFTASQKLAGYLPPLGLKSPPSKASSEILRVLSMILCVSSIDVPVSSFTVIAQQKGFGSY
jgi:hypothetical protein